MFLTKIYLKIRLILELVWAIRKLRFHKKLNRQMNEKNFSEEYTKLCKDHEKTLEIYVMVLHFRIKKLKEEKR